MNLSLEIDQDVSNIPTYAFQPENNQKTSKEKRNKSNDYVDNEILRMELIKSITNKKLTSSAITMLVLMVDNIQSSFTYRNVADKEDCHSNAVEVILNKWIDYDINRDNPFAFFTRMIYNGLYAGWNSIKDKEKKTISFSAVFSESI